MVWMIARHPKVVRPASKLQFLHPKLKMPRIAAVLGSAGLQHALSVGHVALLCGVDYAGRRAHRIASINKDAHNAVAILALCPLPDPASPWVGRAGAPSHYLADVSAVVATRSSRTTTEGAFCAAYSRHASEIGLWMECLCETLSSVQMQPVLMTQCCICALDNVWRLRPSANQCILVGRFGDIRGVQ